MSKSVDDTVIDYFRILLAETEPSQSTEPALASSLDVLTRAAEVPLARQAAIVAAAPQAAVQQQEPAPVTAGVAAKAVPADVLQKQTLEKLLAPVLQQVKVDAAPAPQLEVAVAAQTEVTTQAVEAQVVPQRLEPEMVPEVIPETQTGSEPPSLTYDLQQQLDEEFQVLFFKVAGLTLAVPLVSLGGIVKVERINQIFGRPDWFLGVQTHRESQLNLVDTCAWVMPEKYDEELAQTVNYQYLVLLEDSNWGLACESLVNSVRIKQSEVNWRSKAGKRPWLAGVVKEQMCGILNVQALVEMLNAGLGCQDPIN
ncbi:chemotaxis protein CheW [Shewanella cyperi]|uniref:chemotaxis protein CheW n=1 Tax=Shewanella cyperi TaxID=2814292 RepID=UPI001A952C7C|nr:chemotaxis protein CheW [Shewanella cyperi]QSX39661.1 chemotaxis protein CheW [Shewanella cyperi]